MSVRVCVFYVSPVESIEQVDDLMRCTSGREVREADDVAEVDGDAVEELRLDDAVALELVGDARGQHLIEQSLRLTLLMLQL